MKTYDVFPFFNELDVLEIRLKELWNVVDYFVLVESNLTFTGTSKEFLFEKHKDRFAPFLEKIRHIKVEDNPETTDPWVREKFQRSAGSRGLYDLQPGDIVIVSDCDEIARSELLEIIKEDENDYDRYLLNVPQFNFRLNYMKISDKSRHCQITVTRGRVFTEPQQEREYSFFWTPKPANTVVVDHGGWHFTFQGDDENSLIKFRSYSHTESNVPEITNNFSIEWMIRNKYGFEGVHPDNKERFEYVVVDDYFPKCIVEDTKKWQHLIIPNAVFRVSDLYRETD